MTTPDHSGTLPPTDEDERVARSVLCHIRENRGWYGGKMIEPYETMAVAKLALAIRAALDEEDQNRG